ncbi:uncharacterized protein GIQ15_05657 [Arthroderma uncinatum]|uniref:uncharacterized protein n=1 Tax=Arthroderma uncinatum TaxID=74035 RepID=UPI00144A6E84|nr:uncharacterized protein GIQ15_05657 [Arthroderma uncinatum]KAF3480310.1 hypothetical protein GIQ15_05657 [Arthroderma uncinatum]
MTEPEDLEEDLFADLYDADTTTTTAAPTAPQVQAPAEPASNKAEVAETFNSTQYAASQQPQPVEEHKFEPPPAQNGGHGGIQVVGDSHSGGQASHETENQGTGIKEDG